MIESIKADHIITSILSEPMESRSVEFKPSLPWNDVSSQIQLQEVIKSILGLSNIKDGGKIILGVKQNPDRTFTVEGMKEEHLVTYDSEKIYQDIRSFGEPEPRFEIRSIESGDKFFIVFFIQEFLYSPIICARNGKNVGAEPLVKGALYIRTLKPETKKVDNETEMKEIINLAIEKELDLFSTRMQRVFKTMTQLKVPKSTDQDREKFSEELKDIL